MRGLALAPLLCLLGGCSLLAVFDRGELAPCGADGDGDGDAGGGDGDAELDADVEVDADGRADAEPDLDADREPGALWREVPAGEHDVGAAPGEAGTSSDDARRRITLTRGFLVRATEVTQAEFLDVMGYDPSEHSHALPGSECTDRCPVEGLTWHEAAAFCNALSSAEGLAPCYECSGEGRAITCEPVAGFAEPSACPGVRLPTEVEWEVAARAGDLRETYNGDLDVTEPGYELRSEVLDPIAWYSANSGYRPHEVGLLEPNRWGLHDVLGNVSEWCHDWVPDYSTMPAVDPTVPCGLQCGQRGAHYGVFALYVRVMRRGVALRSEGASGVGLRPVRSL